MGDANETNAVQDVIESYISENGRMPAHGALRELAQITQIKTINALRLYTETNSQRKSGARTVACSRA